MSFADQLVRLTAAGFVVAGAIVARYPQPLSAHAADPTYAEDVAPIQFKNCAACHRDGGMAPFSVLDYDSTVAHADEMRAAVSEGQMLPCHAEGPRGHFLNDRLRAGAGGRAGRRGGGAGAPRGGGGK